MRCCNSGIHNTKRMANDSQLDVVRLRCVLIGKKGKPSGLIHVPLCSVCIARRVNGALTGFTGLHSGVHVSHLSMLLSFLGLPLVSHGTNTVHHSPVMMMFGSAHCVLSVPGKEPRPVGVIPGLTGQSTHLVERAFLVANDDDFIADWSGCFQSGMNGTRPDHGGRGSDGLVLGATRDGGSHSTSAARAEAAGAEAAGAESAGAEAAGAKAARSSTGAEAA
jgi:hypothetical protein